jgi:hypothetical protein
MVLDFSTAGLANPAVAILDAECGRIAPSSPTLHYRRFGSHAQTGASISWQSVSNPAGWPD